MQTSEPLNTASIQAFIQQVKGAEASRAKDIRMDITQAKNLAFTLGIVMARLNGDLEQLIANKPTSEETIDVQLDGGSGW